MSKNTNNQNDISPQELISQLKSSIQLDDALTEEFTLPTIPEVEEVQTLSPEELFRRRRGVGAPKKPEPMPQPQSASDTREVPVVEEKSQSVTPATQEFTAVPPPKKHTPTDLQEIFAQEGASEGAVEGAAEEAVERAVERATEEVVAEAVAEAASEGTAEAVTEEASEGTVEVVTEEAVSEGASESAAADDTYEFDSVSENENTAEVDIDALMKKYLSEAEYQEVLRTRKDAPDGDLALHISEAEEYVTSIESQIEKEGPAEPATETQKALQDMDIQNILGDSEELDETDINLMIAFGMEDELGEKLGDENAQVLEEALNKDAELFAQLKREDNVPDEIDVNMEYTHSSQIKDVFNIYKKQYRNLLIKIFIAIGALVVVFLFENFTALGGKFPIWLDHQVFPIIHIMASLQLLTLSLALVIRPIIDGFKGLFTGKPTSDTILSITVLVSVAYHIALCFVYSDGAPILFCNTATVLCILMSLVARWLNLKRDIFSFNIVSSKRVKYTIAKIPEENTVLEHEAFDEYIDEDSSVFRVTKTNFVDGFFRRTGEYGRNKGAIAAILPICAVLSLFFVLYGGLFLGNWVSGLSCGYLLIALAAPMSSFITYSYPLYRASKVAFDMGSAIVGENSLEEYSNAGAVSFDDKDVFPSAKTKVKSIKIYGNNRIDRIIYNVASLFKVLGGPLCDVFNIATKDFDCSDDVEIVDIADDGIEAVISGKHIFYGKASYLHKNNFESVFEYDDERVEFSGEACISYLVCNDEVAAKLYISYGIDPDFISISKQLYRAGMCIGIKSFDPCIDDHLLAKHVNMSKYAVKVLKCRYLGEKTVTEERSDSGVVSKKNPKSLLKTLALCDRVNSVTRGVFVIKLLSLLVAFAVSMFILFKGSTSYSFAGLYTMLYQLFWMLPILGISFLNIKK